VYTTLERKGAAATIKALEVWSRQSLTKQKWLRGGFEVVVEVRTRLFFVVDGTQRLTARDRQIPKSSTGKVLRRVLQDAYEQKRKRGTTAIKSRL
jgi:acyl-CoA synthetase (AMP-forming)/AMP-acid ligase II